MSSKPKTGRVKRVFANIGLSISRRFSKLRSKSKNKKNSKKNSEESVSCVESKNSENFSGDATQRGQSPSSFKKSSQETSSVLTPMFPGLREELNARLHNAIILNDHNHEDKLSDHESSDRLTNVFEESSNLIGLKHKLAVGRSHNRRKPTKQTERGDSDEVCDNFFTPISLTSNLSTSTTILEHYSNSQLNEETENYSNDYINSSQDLDTTSLNQMNNVDHEEETVKIIDEKNKVDFKIEEERMEFRQGQNKINKVEDLGKNEIFPFSLSFDASQDLDSTVPKNDEKHNINTETKINSSPKADGDRDPDTELNEITSSFDISNELSKSPPKSLQSSDQIIQNELNSNYCAPQVRPRLSFVPSKKNHTNELNSGSDKIHSTLEDTIQSHVEGLSVNKVDDDDESNSPVSVRKRASMFDPSLLNENGDLKVQYRSYHIQSSPILKRNQEFKPPDEHRQSRVCDLVKAFESV